MAGQRRRGIIRSSASRESREAGPALDESKQASEFRHRCYATTGAYIVRRCQILIALWDGNADPENRIKKPSGTWEFVRYQLQGIPPDLTQDDRLNMEDEIGGPVYIIHTPSEERALDSKSGDVRVELPGGVWNDEEDRCHTYKRAARFLAHLRRALGAIPHLNDSSPEYHQSVIRRQWTQFRATCAAINDFNCDIATEWEKIESTATSAVAAFLGEDQASLSPGPLFDRLVRIRAVTGKLSQILQSRLDRCEMGLFAAIALTAFFLHIYAHHFEISSDQTLHDPRWLAASLITIVLAGLTVIWVWFLRLDERRLDYRVLSEALRVRCWWAFVGIDASVIDTYLNQFRSEMAWARKSVFALSPPPKIWRTYFEKLPHDADRAHRVALAAQHWIQKQLAYFKKAVTSHHHTAVQLRRTGLGLAIAAWLMALGIYFFSPRHPSHEILIGSGVLLVAGGLLLAYCERKLHEELANQFDRMAAVFARANKNLDRARSPGGVSAPDCHLRRSLEVMEHVGREAVIEHAQWLILRRSRPFELPIH
ncbi:MAG: hypothetical protein JWL90_3160 [Chthoniobacteraceae bacterium]|nr:hypothetical protein [Chthoniobacteraceae bacterium]